MKLLLVNPYNVGKFGLQNIFQAEPLGLWIIAAGISGHHDVRIQDLRWDRDFRRTLLRFRPDVLGISCLYASHTRPTWDLARQAKRALPDSTVIVGGQPPTLGSQYFHPNDIDVIVLRDGEAAFPELLSALEKGGPLASIPGLILNGPNEQIQTAPRHPTFEFEATPRPNRHTPGIRRRRHSMSFTRPLALMEISRGFPYRCNFCSIWKFAESRVKSKAIDAVVQELSSIEEDSVFFVDDHVFANPHLMLDLGRAITDANLGKTFNIQTRADALVKFPELVAIWRRAGLHAAFMGLEGHNFRRLQEINKSSKLRENETAISLLQEHGIGVVGNLMVDPGFSRDDFSELREYVSRRDFFFVGYCIATPFSGTETWNARRSDITTLNFDLYDIQHAVMKTRLPLNIFYEEYAACRDLRRRLQPASQLRHKLRRAMQVLFKEGLNLELIRNVRRFDSEVCSPEAYLADHVDEPIPWLDHASETTSTFGNELRVAS